MKRDRHISEEPEVTDRPDRPDDTGELVGRGVGGLGGAVVGASAGAVAGPVGMIIGGIAGAAGGWWAGERVAEVVEEMEEEMEAENESRFREHYKASAARVPSFEDARVGYLVGAAASRHPEYRDRSFEDIEADLRHGFGRANDNDGSYSYDEMRPYIRDGYTRGRTEALRAENR